MALRTRAAEWERVARYFFAELAKIHKDTPDLVKFYENYVRDADAVVDQIPVDVGVLTELLALNFKGK